MQCQTLMQCQTFLTIDLNHFSMLLAVVKFNTAFSVFLLLNMIIKELYDIDLTD